MRLSTVASRLPSQPIADRYTDAAARRSWRRYQSLLQQCYADLMLAADKYFAERVDAPFIIPLSAKLPVLLAEPFDICDVDLLETAAIANLHLDHFTQLLDDATDLPDNDCVSGLHLSHNLLVDGIAHYTCASKDPGLLLRRIQVYLREAMEAERTIWRHHGALFSYSDHDYIAVGQRGALSKCAAAFFAALSGNWEPVEALALALESAALGVQLVDDLYDWQTDLHREIYTPPLILVFTDGGLPLSSATDENTIARELIHCGAANAVLGRARMALEASVNWFISARAGEAASVIGELSQNVDRLSDVLGQLHRSRIDNAAELMRHLEAAVDTRLHH